MEHTPSHPTDRDDGTHSFSSHNRYITHSFSSHRQRRWNKRAQKMTWSGSGETIFLSSIFLSIAFKKLFPSPLKNSHYGFPSDQIEGSINPIQLDQMRDEIDSTGDDLYILLSQYNPSFKTCSSMRIHHLLEEVLQQNQQGGLPLPLLQALQKQSIVPSWVDWKLIEKGQCLFLRYPTISSMALMYYSLIGGFAAPKIIKVLNSTGYLSRNQDTTYRRLNETFDMVVKSLNGSDCLHYGQSGWVSVISVRLLHSRVRLHLLPNWDRSTYGQPINQEDMMATLLSFSINILDSLHRVGVPYLTRDDELAFLHLWRYIGYLIGVRDEYNTLTSLSSARGAIQSIVPHLLHPDESSVKLAEHLIHSISNRPPYPLSFLTHSEAVRYFLGDLLPNALQIQSSFAHRLYFRWVIFLLKMVYCITYSSQSSLSLAFFPSVSLSHSHPMIQRNLKKLQKSVSDALSHPSCQPQADQESFSGDAKSCPFYRN